MMFLYYGDPLPALAMLIGLFIIATFAASYLADWLEKRYKNRR